MHFSEYQKIEDLEDEHFWYMAMEETVLRLFIKEFPHKVSVLDAGCGTGGLSKKLENIAEVTAIDINQTAITHAKKKKLQKLVRGNISAMPFPDNSFDAVFCLDVLYHNSVKDDLTALTEIYRVLKPNGKLFLRIPAFESLRGAHDLVVQTRHRYTTSEVKIKLLKCGFKIKKLSYANMILSIPLFFKRVFERQFRHDKAGTDSFKLPYLLNKIFYRILSFENQILDRIDFPFGSSVISLAIK